MTPEPARRRKVLVMGASGFVGSHVTRKLVERGDDVRVYLRKSSLTVAIDDLDVERAYGDLRDDDALRAAMSDRDVVFYCVVDTRFYLRDPAPLFETNVESLRRVLDVAVEREPGPVRVLQHHRHDRHRRKRRIRHRGHAVQLGGRRRRLYRVPPSGRGPGAGLRPRPGTLPAVAMCVSNPYGPLDWQPNQGMMVKAAALGKMPVYVKGVSTEVVGIEDVADAFLLAAERGRIGERYIISESFMPMRQMLETAASAVGAKPPRFGVPLAMLYAVGWIMGTASRVLRRDLSMNVTGVQAPAHHVARRSRQGDTRTRMGTPADRRVDQAGGTVLRRERRGEPE